MSEALEVAHLSHNQINYINSHGTGTYNNDLSESQAMIRLFKESLPVFSSTKGYTGHTLAAAGSLEAVFSILTLTNGTAFANLRFENTIQDTQLLPLTETKLDDFQYVMTNSLGFGGNCTSLVFSKA